MATRKRARMGESVLFNCPEERRTELMTKLLDIAKAEKIIVYHEDSHGFDTAYIGKTKGSGLYEISMGDMYHETHDLRAVMTILHELGHYYDYLSKQDKPSWMEYVHSYAWAREVGAWYEGVKLGKRIGFTEWAAYNDFLVRCLSTYQMAPDEDAHQIAVALMSLQKV